MIQNPTADFVSTTFDVALAQGETGSITAKIGTGLSIPATNSYLQVDYNSTAAVGAANGPETIFYATYTSGTGALTGVVRGQAGTTDVAHDAGAEVQCAMSTAFLHDRTGWEEIKGTFAYASSTTITVAAGAASIYSVGDKLRFQNNNSGTYLYVYITVVADALLTVIGDAVPNATLTDTYYSKAASPVGFPQSFTWTSSYGGFSSAPTQTTSFMMVGKTVYATAGTTNYTGTSNATSFTMTLPIAPQVAFKFACPCADNNSPVATMARGDAATDGTITFYKDGSGTGWTGSSSKGVSFSISYEAT